MNRTILIVFCLIAFSYVASAQDFTPDDSLRFTSSSLLDNQSDSIISVNSVFKIFGESRIDWIQPATNKVYSFDINSTQIIEGGIGYQFMLNGQSGEVRVYKQNDLVRIRIVIPSVDTELIPLTFLIDNYQPM